MNSSKEAGLWHLPKTWIGSINVVFHIFPVANTILEGWWWVKSWTWVGFRTLYMPYQPVDRPKEPASFDIDKKSSISAPQFRHSHHHLIALPASWTFYGSSLCAPVVHSDNVQPREYMTLIVRGDFHLGDCAPSIMNAFKTQKTIFLVMISGYLDPFGVKHTASAVSGPYAGYLVARVFYWQWCDWEKPGVLDRDYQRSKERTGLCWLS